MVRISYDDDNDTDKYQNDLDESDLHNVDTQFVVDSGASTPFEPDVTALSPSKINTEFSEDEMPTPYQHRQ